jgi:DNA-binding CsgD family transcriptional regulator
MSKVPIILFFRNYLIRSGIEHLLKHEIGISSFSIIDEDENLEEKIQHIKNSILIIEDDLFVDNQAFLQNVKVLLLTKNNTISKSEFVDEILDFSKSKQELTEIIQRTIKSFPKNKSEIETEKSGLSEREKSIVYYVALGLTANEIAEKLFISSHTVITHRKNISKKLGIKTVSGLTVYAILNNIVSFEEISGEGNKV